LVRSIDRYHKNNQRSLILLANRLTWSWNTLNLFSVFCTKRELCQDLEPSSLRFQQVDLLVFLISLIVFLSSCFVKDFRAFMKFRMVNSPDFLFMKYAYTLILFSPTAHAVVDKRMTGNTKSLPGKFFNEFILVE